MIGNLGNGVARGSAWPILLCIAWLGPACLAGETAATKGETKPAPDKPETAAKAKELLPGLKDKNRDVRQKALAGLRELAALASVDAIAEHAAGAETAEERSLAVIALASFAPREKVIEAGRKALADKDGAVRCSGFRAMAYLGDTSGFPVAIALLKDPDVNVRRNALRDLRTYACRTFDYKPSGTEDERTAGAAVWENWWKAEGSAFRPAYTLGYSPTAEWSYACFRRCESCRGKMQRGDQMVQAAPNGHALDILTVKCLDCGKTREHAFDSDELTKAYSQKQSRVKDIE